MKKECCKNHESKNKGMLILVILFGMLLIFSVAQTVQITSIKNDIEFGQAALGIPLAGGSARAAPQTSAPAMVGGC